MKMQDLIAGIVDLIGQAQQPDPEEQVVLITQPEERPGTDSPFTNTSGDDVNRFRQIIDLVTDDDTEMEFSNKPSEKYADIESVTTHAGGGVNGPKHPADIKSSTFPMYPDFVARRGE